MEQYDVGIALEVLKKHIARQDPLQKAAVLLSALSTETVLGISRDFSERELRALIPAMAALPYGHTVETFAIVDEFFHHNHLWEIVGTSLVDGEEIIKAFEEWARKNSRQLSRYLKSTWLHSKR
jgi:hypothetical protein